MIDAVYIYTFYTLLGLGAALILAAFLCLLLRGAVAVLCWYLGVATEFLRFMAMRERHRSRRRAP